MDIYTPLSFNKLRSLLFNIKILQYNCLQYYKSFDELLNNPLKAIILFYNTSDTFGHYTLIYFQDGIINLFDSYGPYFPNDELNLIDESFKKTKGMKYNYLVDLILKSKYPIEHNDFRYQGKGNINTCGWWCICRYLLKDLSLDEFKEIFKYKKNKDVYLMKVVKFMLD